MWASSRGHYEVAALLIENGADVNVKSAKVRALERYICILLDTLITTL